MIDLLKRTSHLALLLLLTRAATACSPTDDSTPVTGDENDLTSVTARERTMTFEGYVYVKDGASDFTILQAVRKETKSGFGAIRTAEISANNRELGDVDVKDFVKEPVTIVDPALSRSPTM